MLLCINNYSDCITIGLAYVRWWRPHFVLMSDKYNRQEKKTDGHKPDLPPNVIQYKYTKEQWICIHFFRKKKRIRSVLRKDITICFIFVWYSNKVSMFYFSNSTDWHFDDKAIFDHFPNVRNNSCLFYSSNCASFSVINQIVPFAIDMWQYWRLDIHKCSLLEINAALIVLVQYVSKHVHLGVIVHWLVAYACQVPGRRRLAKMQNNKCVIIEHHLGSFDISLMMQRWFYFTILVMSI